MRSIQLSRWPAVAALLLVVSTPLVISGCDLDANTFSAVTPDTFYKTEGEFLAAVVPVYNQLGSLANGQYWWNSIVSTDEGIVPTRGQDWDDNGAWRRLHQHQWTPTDPATNNPWNDSYTGIARANVVLENLENSSTQLASAAQFKAELRTLRAFFYYVLMDLYGNVPIVTAAVTDPLNPPATNTRREVFNFIEKEIQESLPDLPTKSELGDANSGRVTEGAARAILANMYLNSGEFAGEAMYDKAIEQSDAILNSGEYALANDYFQNFALDNHTSPEIIFSVQFVAQGGPSWDYHFKVLHYNQWPQACCNGLATLGSSYDTFDDEDKRKGIFMAGQAYNLFTGEPAMNRQGNPLIFTKDVPLTGATEADGFRVLKWPADPNDPSGGFQNDYAFFRLAEIYMIKAEALYRLNGPDAALPLINEVRERAFDPSQPVTMADVDAAGGMDQFLLDERMREFHSEAKRRQDLIRFGRYTTSTWGHKTVNEPHRNLFPIPQSQLDANKNLVQNQGYN